MTELGLPETIVEIKKWLQKHIAKNARVIDRNDQIRRFNSGETKWEPRKKGLCNWLKVSTDAKRHVMIWTIDGSEYMKAEARRLADNVEEVIKKELGQTVPVEFKDAPKGTVTSTGASVGICRGELVTEPADDDWPF
jgi:CO dehydrogenase/acetyl-CoA synthase alpha subunit